MVVADVNSFQYVLSRWIVGGKFNKWIVILQEFELDFQSAKSKKSLVFAELIAKFPTEEDVAVEDDSFPDEHILLISTFDPWYGDILIYLHTKDQRWLSRRCAHLGISHPQPLHFL